MAGFDVCLVRLTSCYVLHMVNEPEVRQALKICKYALNHTTAKSSMVDLYQRVCADRFPLPDDPALLTPELLEHAYKTLKKVQNELKLTCKHPVDADIEYLLGKVDNSYQSSVVINGKTVEISVTDKLKRNRQCKQPNFCRDEFYDLYCWLGDKHAYKKADDIFHQANKMGDGVISMQEFSRIIKKEYEKTGRKNFLYAEQSAKIKKRIKTSRCPLLTWFASKFRRPTKVSQKN